MRLAGGPPVWDAARLVAGDDAPVVLTGTWAGARAIVASQPLRTASVDEDPFALLDEQPLMSDSADLIVGGGWLGYLGFQLSRRLERIGAPPPDAEALPDAVLGFYDHVLVLDADGAWWFEALRTPERADVLSARLEVLRERVAAATGPRTAPEPAPGLWTARPSTAGHGAVVDACRERIAAGDLFQANLAMRLSTEQPGSPAEIFSAGVRALGPDRAAYLSGPWGAVASLSPELFLERHGRGVRSAPIKGTRPRPGDPARARRQREELERSAKDRAENVMIVDLVRNDLGRVCRPGSIEVPELARAQAHTGVWHLVSQVTGELRDGVGDADLVRAAFPPGSVTGAPKIAAIEVIHELESVARQVYTGAIGFASPVAGLELSVAIRTFEFAGGTAALQVGGGIVMDSIAADEARECLAKAEPLLRAIGGRVRELPAGAAHAPARRAPRPDPRPDPRAGLLETIAIQRGEPLHLEAHLGRLAAGARELYGIAPPTELATRARAEAAAQSAARLRIVLLPGGEATLEVAALPQAGDLALASVVVPGGLGAHKWADRRLLDALSAAVAPAIALLTDVDGFVLEAAMANVFALLDETLVTPPCDGRILPGTMRAQRPRGGRVARPRDGRAAADAGAARRRERRLPHQRPARHRDGARARRRAASPAARERAAPRRHRRARAPRAARAGLILCSSASEAAQDREAMGRLPGLGGGPLDGDLRVAGEPGAQALGQGLGLVIGRGGDEHVRPAPQRLEPVDLQVLGDLDRLTARAEVDADLPLRALRAAALLRLACLQAGVLGRTLLGRLRKRDVLRLPLLGIGVPARDRHVTQQPGLLDDLAHGVRGTHGLAVVGGVDEHAGPVRADREALGQAGLDVVVQAPVLHAAQHRRRSVGVVEIGAHAPVVAHDASVSARPRDRRTAGAGHPAAAWVTIAG